MTAASHRQPTLESELSRAGVSRSELEEAVAMVRLRLQSRRSVGNVVAKIAAVPAGFTRAIQATENSWQRIENDYGMLQSIEVAKIVGSSSPHRNIASEMRKRGQIIGVERLNRYMFPAFQFNSDGSVKPAMAPLIAAAKAADWSDASLILWLCAPSGSFAGDRPVDHLNDVGMVESASTVMNTDW